MANHSNAGAEGGHPEMDYPSHERTYAGFIKGSIWVSVSVVVILALMAWFLI